MAFLSYCINFANEKLYSKMNTEKQQAAAAAAFAKRWAGRGYEKGDSQTFWTELLTEVFGIENPSSFIRYEEQVKVDTTNFIDGHIPSTRVLIEQKSLGKDLRKGIRQSNGKVLSPFLQARKYILGLPLSEHPRWVVVCNFSEFLVYDMERPNGEPEQIMLANLGREWHRLRFLVNTGSNHIAREMEVSMRAGEIIGEVYDALLEQYGINNGNDDDELLRQLNVLCVRLVFCLYAEDAGIFSRDQLHDYLALFDAPGMRQALLQLFDVLNTPLDQRSHFLRPELAAFPYTNGGLFAESIDIPQFTPELRELLLKNASLDFDWSEISPTIFGAVFESTLNPETRRSGGMHYTSIENIHKVIDPLFLNDLTAELDDILTERVANKRRRRLLDYQERLASLTFLDPACGSGNFLTETYLSLRRLENRLIRSLYEGQAMFLGGEFQNPVRVSINQFYGIEINDFAVTVATTALWISEAQMLVETERIMARNIDFLPLHHYDGIHEGNALRMDWSSVVAPEKLNYIIGNPPFIGYSLQSKSQKEDILNILVDKSGKPFKTAGKIDYVAGWYYKSAQMMQANPNINAALVSTNSITQGEQVASIWKPLKEMFNVSIDFAYRTFRWDSEASLKAHVHCVIIGFSAYKRELAQLQQHKKLIFDGERRIEADNINAYLIDSPDVFIESHNKPICIVPEMITGNRPADGGNLIIEKDDYDDFISKEPLAKKYIKRLLGAAEFINNKERWCLWLVGVSPAELRNMPLVMKRIEACKKDRENAPDPGRRKLSETPHLFREQINPDTFIIVPRVSSERRRYVPMGFMGSDVVSSDSVLIIPDAGLYHFGVLESNVHMAWMRAVCGRLKSDYRYSKDIVYNNFPWPEPTDEQRVMIEQTAQAILDARALYPDASLADLYDELTMPPELRKAHQANDRAVMEAYGLPWRTMTEPECVAHMFKLYEKLVERG